MVFSPPTSALSAAISWSFMTICCKIAARSTLAGAAKDPPLVDSSTAAEACAPKRLLASSFHLARGSPCRRPSAKKRKTSPENRNQKRWARKKKKTKTGEKRGPSFFAFSRSNNNNNINNLEKKIWNA